MKNRKIIQHLGIAGATTLLAFTLLLVCLKRSNFAPFGPYTFAVNDGASQMVDFFGWLRILIKEPESLIYTFSKGLGGSMIGVFAYYLSSPLNLLVMFFKRQNTPVFFNILVVLKLSISAGTMSYYILQRFYRASENRLFHIIISTIYGLSWAFSWYAIRQAYLPMWLDGMMLLPIICLGIYELIKRPNSKLLSVAFFLSLIFNWYTAWINLVFALEWFLVEQLLQSAQKDDFLKNLLNFVKNIASAFLLASFLLVPAFFSMLNGARGGMDFTLLMNLGLREKISRVILTAFGSGHVEVFMGFGIVLLFISKRFSVREKKICAASLALAIVSLIWNPLYIVYSLFREPCGIHNRYLYVIYMPVYFFSALAIIKTLSKKELANKKFKQSHYNFARDFRILFAFCSICCLAQGKQERFNFYQSDPESLARIDYGGQISEESNQLEEIRKQEEHTTSFYRINRPAQKSSLRNMFLFRNDPLSYNYRGLSHYSSTPDEPELDVLNNLGYNTQANTLNVINTSIIPADSLVATRYVIVPEHIKGLQETATPDVYKNPFSLPFGVKYPKTKEVCQNEKELNPFEYQECLYGRLLGREVSFYKKIEYRQDYRAAENEADEYDEIEFEIPEEESVIYLNTDILTFEPKDDDDYKDKTNCSGEFKIIVNDKYQIEKEIFQEETIYIPAKLEQKTGNIKIFGCYNQTKLDLFALQLEEFKKIANELIEKNKANQIQVKNGAISATIESDSLGQALFLAIPYEDKWELKINGAAKSVEKFSDYLISIPLDEGVNEIELKYKAKGIITGVSISLLAIVQIMFETTEERRKNFLRNVVSCWLLSIRLSERPAKA